MHVRSSLTQCRDRPLDPHHHHGTSPRPPCNMSSASVHPRRRPANANSSSMTPSLIESFQNMSIRKGDTFHSPSPANKNQLWDPLESRRESLSMPARSTTCPKSLEDLLIGAGERRAAELFRRVDEAIATNSKLALGAVLSEPEVLPVPSFMLDQTSVQDDAAAHTVRPRVHRHSHSSDSGIGSSVAGSTDSVDAKRSATGQQSPSIADTLDANESSDNKSTSTAGQSFSGISAASDERGLSKYAVEQIHKHIVKPILRETALREFHPLVSSVPERIGSKEIKNLRDLEKTLIFLAPVSDRTRLRSGCASTHWCSGVKDHSRSPSKYLQFCERTIRVLHTTVTTLHESDQRAPADRPYTQGYFFDLVEQVCLTDGELLWEPQVIDSLVQIRRYAAILAAEREKHAKSGAADEMEHTE